MASTRNNPQQPYNAPDPKEEHAMYILTGGPCTGKTTMCKELAAMGYDMLPEAARAVITEEEKKSVGILPWTDYAQFQILVLHKQLDLEKRVNGTPTFLDRSIIDNIAYCRVGGTEVPRELADKVREYATNGHYKKVFLLDPVPYCTDAERREDPALARRIHETIGEVYRELGYHPMHVPIMESPKARAAYIAACVQEQESKDAKRGRAWAA